MRVHSSLYIYIFFCLTAISRENHLVISVITQSVIEEVRYLAPLLIIALFAFCIITRIRQPSQPSATILTFRIGKKSRRKMLQIRDSLLWIFLIFKILDLKVPTAFISLLVLSKFCLFVCFFVYIICPFLLVIYIRRVDSEQSSLICGRILKIFA